MMCTAPERRFVERDAFCRACDKRLKRNVAEAIVWHSFRNTGQNILICLPCAREIGGLAAQETPNEIGA